MQHLRRRRAEARRDLAKYVWISWHRRVMMPEVMAEEGLGVGFGSLSRDGTREDVFSCQERAAFLPVFHTP